MLVVYFIFFLTAFINFLFGAVKFKSKILYGFSILIIFVLMTFNFEGPDVVVYRLAYDIVGNTTGDPYKTTYMEWGYTSLMILSNKIGFDFFAFRIILSFACLLLFNSSIRYYKVNGNLIIGLYMMYLFFFDTIQLRNCISQFIILFSTRFLLNKSWGATLKYLLCVVVAASFHTISWVYLSFLIVKVSRKELFFKNLFLFSVVLFLLCIATKPVFQQVVKNISIFIGHGSSYFQGNVEYGYWIVFAIHLIGIVPLYLFKKYVKNIAVRDNINFIMNINIILCLFLPLALLNNNFNRILRNNMILTQIALALMYVNSKKSSRSGQVAFVSLLLFTAGWGISDIKRYDISKIVIPIMEKNLFFNLNSSANYKLYILVIVMCILLMSIIYFLCSKNCYNKCKRYSGIKDLRQDKCL